jgi:predicted lipoprotein with Yx(FWY)xxD motif
MGQARQWRRQSTGSIPIGVVAALVGGVAASSATVGIAGAAARHTSKTVVISLAKSTQFGSILASTKTLYTLTPSKTACTATCHKIWPELLLPKGVTKATAGTGVNASKIGIVTRPGGELQVTYSGKALYYFSGDKAAGQVRGNVTDTWGTWSDVVVVKPANSSSGGGGNPGTGGTAF